AAAIACFAVIGNAAKRIPSIAKNNPIAARKSGHACGPRGYGGRNLTKSLFGVGRGGGRRFLRRGRGCRFRAGPRQRRGEVAEEIRIRPKHKPRIAVLQALLVGLHGTVESEEVGIAVIRVGKDAIALAVALTAGLLGLGVGLGEQDGHVAVGPGPDLLALLASLGPELGRFALALSLHALVHRLAVLLRQVGAAD